MSDVWHKGLTLRQWRLKNFKSVRSADVDLAPLTIVVGANSAGKSTLLQSIRAAAQAASATGQVFPLNGEQIRLGTFAETRWVGAANENESIALGGCFVIGDEAGINPIAGRLTVSQRMRWQRHQAEEAFVEWDVALQSAPASTLTRIQELRVETVLDGQEAGRLRVAAYSAAEKAFTFGNESTYNGEIGDDGGGWRDLVDLDIRGGFPLRALLKQDLANSLISIWIHAQQRPMRPTVARTRRGHDMSEPLSDSDLASIIADDLSKVLDQIDVADVTDYREERRIALMLRDIFNDRPPLQFNWAPEPFAEAERNIRRRVGAAEVAREVELPEAIKDFSDQIREFLAQSVQHLGPLRFEPQVVYRMAPVASPGFIGASGEYTAAVLQASGSTRVLVPMPRRVGSQLVPLREAVNRWAEELGIGSSFATADLGRLGLQLSTRQPGVDVPLDLTSVGTGVSQLLPVLVMCLQAPPGSLLLIEQPELHLNPAVQQRLADFLLAVAESGRQLIVETHSEHLITRLRLRTVQDETGATRERIAIVFAERVEGATSYRTVKPEEDGSMSSWPAGFFDEAAIEAEQLLQAMIEFRLRNPGST